MRAPVRSDRPAPASFPFARMCGSNATQSVVSSVLPTAFDHRRFPAIVSVISLQAMGFSAVSNTCPGAGSVHKDVRLGLVDTLDLSRWGRGARSLAHSTTERCTVTG